MRSAPFRPIGLFGPALLGLALVPALPAAGAQEAEAPAAPGPSAEPGDAVCADPWYGGCPDSCTRSFRRLQDRGALTGERLEAWAERCLKGEEGEGGTSGGQQQAGRQPQQGGEGQGRAEQPSSADQRGSGERSASPGTEAESRQATERARSERREATGGASAPGETQASRSPAEENEQSSAGATQGERQDRRRQAGGRRPSAAGAARDAPPEGGSVPAGRQGAPETAPAEPARPAERGGERGRRSGPDAAEGPIGELAEDQRRQAPAGRPGDRSGEDEGDAAPPGSGASPAPTRDGEPESGRGRGEPLRTPLPRGQGSTGRPYTPFDREPDEPAGRRFGQNLFGSGLACGLAAAPMCGGSCQAGICAPSAGGGGCRCRPARTPESADHRRRALCAMPEPDRLRVALCRPAAPGVAATCAVGGGADSPLCEELWSVGYAAIDTLEGGRADLDLRLEPVPVWDWAREGEAIDRVSVPLGESGRSVHPRGVWERADQPLPASDVRLMVGSKSSGRVALLRPDGEGGIVESETALRRTQLVSDCEEDSAVCAEEQLARLRLTLVAQAPETRILATHTEEGADWYGECAAYRLEGRARVICYQLESAGTGSARAWNPLRLDWLGEETGAAYAEALLGADGDRPEIEAGFFARAAATAGDAPPLLLAVVSAEAERAYRAGEVPAAGAPAETTPAGMLVLEGDRLTRLTQEGAGPLPARTRALLVRAMAALERADAAVVARLAAAATLDPEMGLLVHELGAGACLRRSRPQAAIQCVHGGTDPAVWNPLAWPGEGMRPRIDRGALLAAAARAAQARGATLEAVPALDLLLSAAASPEGRYLRGFDIYRAEGAGEGWRGLILAFRRSDAQADALMADCTEAALLLTERRRTPLAAPLRMLEDDGRSCTEAFAETYATHRSALHQRLARRLPAELTGLTLHGERALLASRTPAGIRMMELWSADPAVERRFPTVTARCLMQRTREAASLAPGGAAPDEAALERALLNENWRALGWRANPLGLMLRAESCEEGV